MQTVPDTLVLGIDYGTDSCRVVVIDAANGAELAQAVAQYPRWAKGLFCDPARNIFRQHPLDYVETLVSAAHTIAATPGGTELLAKVRGVAVDTTGSTPCAVSAQLVPLALLPGFENDPDAMFVLWKDHSAIEEVDRINEAARAWVNAGGADYLQYEGGIYSSEWFWAKAAHLLSTNASVASAAVSFVEHCDWMPALLTGLTSLSGAVPPESASRDVFAQLKRSRCAMGHKAMWHEDFGGYPDDAFLAQVHPGLPRIKKTLGTETFPSDTVFGALSKDWAAKLGLPAGIPVAVGALDAHMGAVGGGVEEGVLLKVMGTSTCDMIVGPDTGKTVSGICGQVDGSIIPGLLGYEAGQSAFGDVYAWFRNLLFWPLEKIAQDESPNCQAAAAHAKDMLMIWLEEEAAKLAPGKAGVIALDWMNGRRTPDANQKLKGALANLSLGTTAPMIYRALIEATAFGSRAIIDRFIEEGVHIEKIRAIGGVARKSRLVMRIVADVLGKPVEIVSSDQCVALGAGMFASVVAGIHRSIPEAQKAMRPRIEAVVEPDPAAVPVYAALYQRYKEFGTFIESWNLENTFQNVAGSVGVSSDIVS